MCSVIMSSCSKKTNFTSEDLKSSTKGFELINYNDSTNGVVVSVIEEGDYISFIDDFMTLDITITFGAPGNPHGYGIKIIYNDDYYHIITKYYMAYYSEDSKLLREDRISLKNDVFDSIIMKYLVE